MHKILVTIGCIVCCVRSAQAVDSIPDVKALADLRRLPAIHTTAGDVRVGMADPGEDAGPYRLIYCLMNQKAKPDGGYKYSERFVLGPLGVGLLRAGIKEDMLKSVGGVAGNPRDQLYCQSLPIGDVDDLTVQVFDDKTLLMERKLGKSDHRPRYWTKSFVATHDAGYTYPAGYAIAADTYAAYPKFGECMNLLRAVRPGDTTRPALPEEAPLPGSVTLPAEWLKFYFPAGGSGPPLTLAMNSQGFSITCQGFDLWDSIETEFLARWWLNDHPVTIGSALPAKSHGSSGGQQETSVQQVSVAFGLPGFLGALKAGDQIGIQLLYVPEMGRFPSQMEMMSRPIFGLPVPLLSNRLDFKLDARLLSLAEKRREHQDATLPEQRAAQNTKSS